MRRGAIPLLYIISDCDLEPATEDPRNTVNTESGGPVHEGPRQASPAPSGRTGTGMDPGTVEKPAPARRRGPRERKKITVTKKPLGEPLQDDILPRSQ